MRRYIRSFTFCFLLWVVFSSMVRAQEIGFVERFALAKDRNAALATLIPGTDEYFFYHTLHSQNSGRLAEAKGYIDAWISKFGETSKVREMRIRQTLLSYPDAPKATLDFLQREFGLQLDHPAPRRDAAAELPTRLNPDFIDWSKRWKDAVTTGSRLEQIEDSHLADALAMIEYQPDFRAWIERISRPDIAGLVEVIARELQQPDSRGFGWATIHRHLTLQQLDQLLQLFPKAIDSDTFVQTYLMRLRPSDDASLTDVDTRRAHLDRLEKFSDRLAESQNSLKAAILYHRLKLDDSQGVIDRARFLKYLALPRQTGYVNDELARQQASRPPINFGQDFSGTISLPPIGSDADLIQNYLEHFFQADQDFQAFSKLLNSEYLRRVFASTKILYGLGDGKAYYAQLNPDQQKELQDRVELRFASSNQEHYVPADRVSLDVSIKNVPQLIVKIYRLHPKNILRAQSSNVSTAIDLDGMVANIERTIDFSQAADRRHVETLAFPELVDRGVWVVDLLGGGQRSRAFIQKGQLRSLRSISDAGHLFRIVNEEGNLVPSARVLLGEREFAPDKDGAIVVPFASSTETRTLILADGSFASLESFQHLAEDYKVVAGFLVEPQSLRPGAKTAVVIRSQLTCNGIPVSIDMLEQSQLTITATDQDGLQTSQTFKSIELSESLEFSQPFLVPQRLVSLAFSLSGKVHNLSQAIHQTISAEQTISVNGIASTAQIGDFHLARHARGFRLEGRGRNGEPISRLPIQLIVKQRGIRSPIQMTLATDQDGFVDLGELLKVESLTVHANGLQPRTFIIDEMWLDWPSTLHVLEGQPMVLAWPEAGVNDAGTIRRFSLLEYRGGQVIASWSKNLRFEQGKLRADALAAGSYRLTDHHTGVSTVIDVVQGREEDGYLFGRNRALEANRRSGAMIASTSLGDGKLTIQLDGHDSSTRVHLVAATFDRSLEAVRTMQTVNPSPLRFNQASMPSFYLDSMRLDEEYQYVLQRQLAKKFPGSMLPQPSVLLNPWELSVTSNESQVAQAGDAIADMAATPPAPAAMPRNPRGANRSSTEDAGTLYDFLARGAFVVSNLRPSEAGQVSIEMSVLDGLTNVIAVVVHPHGTTYRRIALSMDSPRKLADNRLLKAFEPDRKLAERQRVRVLAADKKNDLGEAVSTRVRAYGSLAEIYALYSTFLNQNADYAKFQVLQSWSSLSDEEKQVQYGLLVCHEWNLFLYFHDPDFFDRVVKPYLANKLEKQFIDEWLLGDDLVRYTQPWRLERMNPVERALLAMRLPTYKSAMSRWFRDSLEIQPEVLNPAIRNDRFGTALLGNALNLDGLQRSDDYLFAAPRSDIELQLQESKELSFEAGGMGGSLGELRGESAKASSSLGLARKSQSVDKKEKSQLRRLAERDRSVPLFRPLEATRKWAETQYYHVPLANQSPSLARVNAFWRDFVDRDSTKPFLSENLDAPTASLSEALMALAVTQLPIEAKPVELAVENGRLIATHPTASVAFVQSIESVEPAQEPTSILVGQDIYLVAPSDTSQAKPIQDKPMLINVAYRATVVLTNPTSSPKRVQVLTQIPQGAIALSAGKMVRGTALELGPYSSQQISYDFYFPAAGKFDHYGAQVSNDSGHLASAASSSFTVLEKPESVDETTWAYVAAWGSNDQVHAYLKKANLQQIDLSAIAWRLQNRVFFDATLDLLTQLGRYDATLWAYAVKHNSEKRLVEWIEASEQISNAVGPVLKSKLLSVEPVERFQYQHLDFRPMVVARIHQLGSKRIILNDGLNEHYQRFMNCLAYQGEIDPAQQLSIVYYLLIQNRIEEAMGHFEAILPNRIDQSLQYDYFAALFDLYRGNDAMANQRAAKHIHHPVPRWRDWFAQVRSHVAARQQAERGEAIEEFAAEKWQTDPQQSVLSGTRESNQMANAAKMPSLDLLDESGTLRVQHRNIDKLNVHYFLMDIELLFSRKPFVQHDGTRLSAIEPNHSEVIDLPAGSTSQVLSIPDSLKNRNMVVEVVGNGLTRSHAVYANSLTVALSTQMGRLQTLSSADRKPLKQAYVKVYARHQDGSVRFYKDGYTDLRGQFDYATLSTNDLVTTQRFSILVIHPEHGAIIREAEPPQK